MTDTDALADFPDIPGTVWTAYANAATNVPAVEAVTEGSDRLSYSELVSRAEAIARGLVAKGIRMGDHVGICAGNGPDWVALFCGILRAGAVCVPINTRLKPDEIAHQLRLGDVRALFTVDTLLKIDFLAALDEICPEVARGGAHADLPHLRDIVVLGERTYGSCQNFDAFLDVGQDHGLPPEPQPEDAALIQFTSGTTTLPKGVLLTHRNMVTDAYFVGAKMGLKPRDRYMSARPFFHVAGSTLSVVVAAVQQITLITMKRFIAEDALRILAEKNCTHTSGNDTMFLMMLASPDFRNHSYSLRGGWAAASPSVVERIINEFGASETVVAYGLSEASPNVALSRYDADEDDRIAGWMTPHPGLDLRIVDPDTGDARPPGEEGEIQVRGWCVMAGYYQNPDATTETMTRDGYLKTGDVGIRRANGDIRFIGRLKEIIRVGGENVAPSDIENILNQHPSVQQAVAFGLPDPRLIEVPGAYVVPQRNTGISEDELLGWAKNKLAGFKLPKYLAFVDSFDAIGVTASAKVQKKHLVKHAIEKFGLEGAE